MKYSVVYTLENGLKKSSEKKDNGADGDLERDNNSYAG